MEREVRTLMFGDEQECRAAAEMLRTMEPLSGCQHSLCHASELEAYEKALVDWNPTLLIVLAEGAEGMECVYRSRERRPLLPVFWFSDDRAFSMQSYRMNCAYFSTKPISKEKLSNAFHRCSHLGIRYEAV